MIVIVNSAASDVRKVEAVQILTDTNLVFAALKES